MGYRDTSKTAEQITSIAKHHGFFFVRAGVTANSGHRKTLTQCHALCRQGVLRYTGTSHQQEAHFTFVGDAGTPEAQREAARLLKQKAKRKACLFTRDSAIDHLRKHGGEIAIHKKARSRRINSLRSHLMELAKRGKVSIEDPKNGVVTFHLLP
tara:strand:- start:3108 stop:3569 length:462 start_codon:yes stop_codon:yes gene_type:complete